MITCPVCGTETENKENKVKICLQCKLNKRYKNQEIGVKKRSKKNKYQWGYIKIKGEK